MIKRCIAASCTEPTTFWNAWREPWAEICSKLEPVLNELGYTHIARRDDSLAFVTLPERCLAAFAELRSLRGQQKR